MKPNCIKICTVYQKKIDEIIYGSQVIKHHSPWFIEYKIGVETYAKHVLSSLFVYKLDDKGKKAVGKVIEREDRQIAIFYAYGKNLRILNSNGVPAFYSMSTKSQDIFDFWYAGKLPRDVWPAIHTFLADSVTLLERVPRAEVEKWYPKSQ